MDDAEAVEFERTSGSPSGWKAKLKGRESLWFIMIVGQWVIIGYLLVFNLGSWGEPFNLRSSFTEHNQSMETQHRDYINGVAELTYVMSVCLNPARVKECESLRISMPDSLYRKLSMNRSP